MAPVPERTISAACLGALADAAVTAPCPEDTAWRVEVEQTRTQVPWLDEGSLLVARDGTIAYKHVGPLTAQSVASGPFRDAIAAAARKGG